MNFLVGLNWLFFLFRWPDADLGKFGIILPGPTLSYAIFIRRKTIRTFSFWIACLNMFVNKPERISKLNSNLGSVKCVKICSFVALKLNFQLTSTAGHLEGYKKKLEIMRQIEIDEITKTGYCVFLIDGIKMCKLLFGKCDKILGIP